MQKRAAAEALGDEQQRGAEQTNEQTTIKQQRDLITGSLSVVI